MIERFWAVVYDEMQGNQLGIAPGCEDGLRQFIDKGVDELRRGGATKEQLRKAEDDLRRFVRAMAEEATKKGYNELHEDTLAWARSLFCPGTWPFC